MDYKDTKQTIEKFKYTRLIKFANSKRYSYHGLFYFIGITEIGENLRILIDQTYASSSRRFKGQSLFQGFVKVLKNLNNGGKTREALNNNRHLSNYHFEKTSHRKLFYKLCNQLKQTIIQFCNCKSLKDFQTLNYIQPMKGMRAGAKYKGYKEEDLDPLVVEMGRMMNIYSRNNYSMFIRMLNRGTLDEYLKALIGTFDKQEYEDKIIEIIDGYQLFKNHKYLLNLTIYRSNVILNAHHLKSFKRRLGITHDKISPIYPPGLMQLDVKETHQGDLRNFRKMYWMCIVDYELGFIYREPTRTKPRSGEQREFLQRAEQEFINKGNIPFLSVQMDNDPSYNPKPRADNIAGYLYNKNITHINIPKREKTYNGKIENTNKHIDYEFLPLIHTAKDFETIVKRTKQYNDLHNYHIPRLIKRTIGNSVVKFVKTPIERWNEFKKNTYEYDYSYLEKYKN